MVRLGVDAHKRTHTIVAIDRVGPVVAAITVAATTAGHLKALRWAQSVADERLWALGDRRHLTRRLEADVLRASESVVRVPPTMMAGARRSVRQRGKSDPIDAQAVARAALRDPGLPVARPDGAEREPRLPGDHREDLVAQRTRTQNRLRRHRHALGSNDIPAGALDRFATLDRLRARLTGRDELVAAITAELVDRRRELTGRANQLERQIATRAGILAPSLMTPPGCGALTAAKLVGEAAGVGRLRSRSAFAAANGTAPVPVWSGNRERFRLNRGGNRQVNTALHRIVVTQIRVPDPARDYIARRIANGDTKTEAIRAPRRRMSDIVYRRLVADEQTRQAAPATCVAQAA
ncbi:MAG: IS110 family transposase [Actinomycetota bacterium]|nr:IS110 family transposase [Actinomycetota bacterium]